jgi:hypothetical protein
MFNANPAIFQLYYGENKLIFNGMMMTSALYYSDNVQKYSPASNLPYIFHIKLQFFKILSWNQFTSDFNHYFIKESRKVCSL